MLPASLQGQRIALCNTRISCVLTYNLIWSRKGFADRSAGWRNLLLCWCGGPANTGILVTRVSLLCSWHDPQTSIPGWSGYWDRGPYCQCSAIYCAKRLRAALSTTPWLQFSEARHNDLLIWKHSCKDYLFQSTPFRTLLCISTGRDFNKWIQCNIRRRSSSLQTKHMYSRWNVSDASTWVSTALFLVVIGVLHDYVDWFNYFRMTCSSNSTVFWQVKECKLSTLTVTLLPRAWLW